MSIMCFLNKNIPNLSTLFTKRIILSLLVDKLFDTPLEPYMPHHAEMCHKSRLIKWATYEPLQFKFENNKI